MRISFKYPPIERGMEINIVSGLFNGVKKVLVNGEEAKLIDRRRGQYEYYDPNLERNRLLSIVINVFDYPQFYVDGKEIELFPRIERFFKFFIFLPVIYSMMFDLKVGVIAFMLALVNVFFNLALIKITTSKILRVIFVVGMTVVGGILTYVLINTFFELFVDWGWIKAPEAAIYYIRALLNK